MPKKPKVILTENTKRELNKQLEEIIMTFAFFLSNAKRAIDNSNKTCAQRSRVSGVALSKQLKKWRETTVEVGLTFKLSE